MLEPFAGIANIQAEYTLWHRLGASSFVSLVALEETGASYTLSEQDGGERSTLLRAPRGLISENIAIVTYLAQRHPKARMLPSYNKYSMSLALSWMLKCASSLEISIERLKESRHPSDLHSTHARLVERAKDAINKQFEFAEVQLCDGPWLLGTTWSMADIYLFWCWRGALALGVKSVAFPRMQELCSRVMGRPSVMRAMEIDPLLDEVQQPESFVHMPLVASR